MKSAVKLLIVEDEHIVAKDIQQRLIRMGYNDPAIVSTGEEALTRIKEIGPDLILMDIMLAKGVMDGVETTERIYTEYDIPVIYLTAYADEYSLARAKKTQPFGYILKPFQTRDLSITIEMALHKSRIDKGLKRSRSLLSSTLAGIDEGVISIDSSRKITFANALAAAMLGMTEVDLLGKRIENIFAIRHPTTSRLLVDPVTQLFESENASLVLNDVVLTTLRGVHRPIYCAAAKVHSEGNQNVVLVFRDITDQKQSEEWIRYLAYHDTLTGLYNRTFLFETLIPLLEEVKNDDRTLSFFFIDLDNFKVLNDSFGHQVGDNILKDVARRLATLIKADDFVVRLSGDEFVVIARDIRDTESLIRIAEDVQAQLSIPFHAKDMDISVSCSIGLAVFPRDGDELDTILHKADQAMYVAKGKGKNTFAFSSDLMNGKNKRMDSFRSGLQ